MTLGQRLITAAEEAREIVRGMTWVSHEAITLKQQAHAGPIGKRHSSFELYDLLGRCMSLANRCEKDPAAEEELRRLVREEPSAGKGRWVTRESDAYLLVCRFVFPRRGTSRGQLSNASRYATAMREAAKLQIHPESLSAFLRQQGGIDALFRARKSQETRTTRAAKIIYLSRAVELPTSGGEFTLTLYYDRTSGRYVPVEKEA